MRLAGGRLIKVYPPFSRASHAVAVTLLSSSEDGMAERLWALDPWPALLDPPLLELQWPGQNASSTLRAAAAVVSRLYTAATRCALLGHIASEAEVAAVLREETTAPALESWLASSAHL